MLCIQHANVHTPEESLPDSTVLLEGGRIVALGAPCPPDAHQLDASGLILAPGFIDIQINGAFGYDFTSDPSSMWEVARQLPRYGVTAFLPTIITSPLEQVATAQRALLLGPPDAFEGALPLGLHVEGPFLNPSRSGAHNPKYLRLPTLEAVRDWSPERGVRLVTLAPELPGALAVIRLLAGRGVVVSAGHSQASVEEAGKAFEAGLRCGTHLFNAMPPMEQRIPGLAGALLAHRAKPGEPEIVCGLICDGIHLHPATVMLAWKVLGAGRTLLITDAIAALGLPAGRYSLGDQEVIIDRVSSRLPDGRLAGSILNLDQAVRNLIAFTGCGFAEALRTVTTNPAQLLGMAGEIGHVLPGRAADLVLLTPAGEVVATLVRGRIVYSSDAARFAPGTA
jgi:N-acetylglucosamine-6-phosphate deacetylase